MGPAVQRFVLLAALAALLSGAAKPSVSQIKFDEMIYDFGEVYRGAELTHRFRFVNLGTGALNVQGVHAACGCTAVEVDKGKMYGAGESGYVDVKLDTADFSGSMLKTVTVHTNEQVLPERTLTLKAFVKAELEAIPPLADFGDTPTRGGAVVDVSLKTLNAFKLEVGDLVFDERSLEVTKQVTDGGAVLKIKLKDGLKPGFLKETILVKTNAKHLPELKIPVRATVKGAIEAAPGYVEFGAISPSEQAKRSITLTGARGFEVTGSRVELLVNGRKIEGADGVVGVKLPPPGGSSKQLVVEVKNPSRYPGAMHGKVFLKTTDPEQQEVSVDIYAFFR